MLPSYFDYVFVHLRQKARAGPELSPKFCQLKAKPGPNPNSTSRAQFITLFLMSFRLVV